MTSYLALVVASLLGSLALGLMRVVYGPGDSDRLLGVLLTGTTGVAVLLVLAALERNHSILDVALVLAILAPITTAAFVAKRPATRDPESDS